MNLFLATALLTLGSFGVQAASPGTATGVVSFSPDAGDEFDFNIGRPDFNEAGFNQDFGAVNIVGPFKFDLEGIPVSAGFQVALSSCGSGTVNFAGGTNLDQTFDFVNPSAGFDTVTFCVDAVLSLPENGVREDLVSLRYSVTLTVNDNGTFSLTTSSDLTLPDKTTEDNALDKATKDITTLLQGDSTLTIPDITLGTTVTPKVTSTTTGYTFTVTECTVGGKAITLTDGSFESTEIPITEFTGGAVASSFTCSVDFALAAAEAAEAAAAEAPAAEAPGNRALRGLQEASEEVTSGTISLTTEVELNTPTGSGAFGSSMAASALALVAAALMA